MNYLVFYICKNHCMQRVISDRSHLTVGSSQKDDFYCAEYKSAQITISNKNSIVSADSKSPLSYSVERFDVPGISVVDRQNNMLICVDNIKRDFTQKIELPHNSEITIGRSDKCNITLKSRFVSSQHCRIQRQNGIYYIEDCESTNGTYHNGLRVSKTRLESGDKINIFSYTISLESGALVFSNVGDDIKVNSLPRDVSNEKGSSYVVGNKPVYQRSPRTQEELPVNDIVLANPPAKGQRFEKSRGKFSSIASSAAMMSTSMIAGGPVSAAMLAARSAMLIMPVSNIATQNSNEKRSKKKSQNYEKLRIERFENYLNEQRAVIGSAMNQQRKIITDENPSPCECLAIANNLNRNLWERTPSDRDFLDVRLGMGYENLCINVRSNVSAYGVELEDDDAKEMTAMLVEEAKYVDNIPVRVSLARNNSIGIIGERARVINQVRNMITELTAFHCYTDVRIIGIFDEKEYDVWSSLRWLPHVWDEDSQIRYLSFDEETAHALCEGFGDIVKARTKAAQNSSGRGKQFDLPYYVFIAGSKQYLANEEIMADLSGLTPAAGITTLFLFDDIYSLPTTCDYIIDMQPMPVAYWRTKVNSKFVFTPDEFNEKQFEAFTRRLSAIELKGYAIKKDMPSSITFLQGYNVKTVEELNIAERWQSSKAYETLAAPIGILAGEKTFSLNVFDASSKGGADIHGPHGLVAGTTGSGKSELLMTWILSMCVNYHPYDVNFVLIDYKGGGMANAFEGVPHIVGKITNIGTDIKRSLVSLKQENKRRMEIFEKVNVNNITKYQKLYHSGKVSEPLPHLIIVADEFAELKKDQPEFMAELVTIARVGRSLGMHLVLATQKPSGVVDDQIWSNSRFKLCLRVQDVGDSREMLRTPDAAKITQAGRCYIQVGSAEFCECYELFQSYWSGAPYFGENVKKVETGNCVRLVQMNGEKVKAVAEEKSRIKSDIDEMKAVVNYAKYVAEQNHIKALQGPWMPELPESFDMNYLNEKLGEFGKNSMLPQSNSELKIPVGIYDLPELQCQGIMSLDFVTDGHYGVYGAPGSGKTALLKTMLSSACGLYTPDDINFYILDCGGWSMSAYKNMPHVGDVILDVEEEKILKFQKLISDEIDRRRKLFLDNIVSSFSAYRQSVGSLPAVVVVVDNIVSLFDMYPDIEATMIRISREGSTYGIYLIYTANSTTGVRFKVLQNIKGAVAFELTDKGDYSSIIGKIEGKTLPHIPGRALFKGAVTVNAQCAMFANGENDIERVSNIKKLCEELRSEWKGYLPAKIPVMPEHVNVDEIKPEYSKRNLIPLGICYDTISTAFANMETSYCMLVTGGSSSGKSKYLCRIIDIINNPDNMLYLFDSGNETFSRYRDAAAAYTSVADASGVADTINEIVQMLNERQRAQNAAALQPGHDPAAFIADEKQICVFIDDLNEFIDAVENSQRDMMNNIARLAKNLGVIFFAAGRATDIIRLNDIEPLTNTIVKYQNGVCIGSKAGSYPFFKNDLSFNEKEVSCENSDAWLFNTGTCKKIKIE